jgi:hypothetical protein
MPLTEWDTLFESAEFEFVDMIESSKGKDEGGKARARQCQAKDFNNNDRTRAYYDAHKEHIMLCPSQDELFMENSLEDPDYKRRFDF